MSERSGSAGEELRGNLRSGKHSVFIHFPQDPNCDICFKTKMTRASCRRRAGTVVPRADNVGDLITADHKILSEGSESRNNHRYAVVVQDLAIQWIQIKSYPGETKTSQETQRSLQKILEPTRKPKVIYTDNSLNLAKNVKNYLGIIVRQRHTDQKQMGLRKSSAQSKGRHLLRCCCNQVWTMNAVRIPWNVTAICKTFKTSCLMGKTPYERRFGVPFNGPVIPFGTMVEYHPISAEDPLHQFVPKVLPAIFLGYVSYAVRIWKGDILIADNEALEEMDTQKSTPEGSMQKEVLTLMKGDNFIFPVADGTVKTPGGDRRLRPSPLIRDRPERGEEQEILSKPFFKMT